MYISQTIFEVKHVLDTNLRPNLRPFSEMILIVTRR